MKVVITPRGFAKCGLDEIERLKSHGLVVDYNDTGKAYDAETFISKIKDADAVIVGVDDMHDDVLEQCEKLKVVCKFGVGTDNIGVKWCQDHGVYVGRTIGSNSLSVAEHVAALMFADAKNLYRTIKEVKAGKWNKYTGQELAGKTLGIVGFGAIGKCLAKIATGIGMNVLAYDVMEISSEVASEYQVKVVDLEQIYQDSDYISLHIPLLDSTANMINKDVFEKMKPTACLLNAARGGIVDEKDLYVALTEGEIRSAAFDVFSTEPPQPNEQLLLLDNFVLTSHTASRSAEAEKRTCEISTNIILEQLGL